ncbi:MAG: LXG domain-containing protein [Clostridiales Family XIII bacterium]|jgi:hypothetical protein|nr:LXG domain-containing protein [Clostridiales Family XIII bacterium]
MQLRILYDELASFQKSFNEKTALWGTNLEALSNNTKRLVEMDSFRGSTAESVKHYLTEVHYTALWAMSSILTEFSIKLLLYKDGYNQIDKALHAKCSEAVLDDILEFFQGSHNTFDDTHARLQQTANSISDIMAAPMPSPDVVSDDYRIVHKDQFKLREDLLQHEQSHYNADFASLDSMIADLGTFLTEALNLDNNSMNLYQSGAVAQSVAFCNLVGSLRSVEKQWESQDVALDAALTREADRLAAAQREEDGKFKIFTSILEIAGGVCAIVVSTVAIVASAGVATPLAVVGIAGGVGMILHGSAELEEGIGMVSLGRAGNMSDAPHNWLRDNVMSVFGEENKQTAYDVFGAVSAVAGVVGSAGSCAWASAAKLGVTAGGQIVRAVVVEEGKVAVSALAGMAGGKASGWVATNLLGVDENTARYVEVIGGIATGAAAYGGANVLDRRFNWNGLNPSLQTSLQLTRASIDRKLDTYLLDPLHPTGRTKAEWFRQALGYERRNAADLAKQIIFDERVAVPTELTEFGQKFSQMIPVTGANGRLIEVQFIWIRGHDGVVKLVTAIPPKKK